MEQPNPAEIATAFGVLHQQMPLLVNLPAMQQGQAILNAIQGVRDDVQAVKDDVQALKDDVQAVKDDVQAVKDDIQALVGETRKAHNRYVFPCIC